MMSGIRASNTTPERLVRSALHKRGLRFRLHAAKLPGKPDLVFPRYRSVVFVHGCFWHLHARCPAGRIPKSNIAWWRAKLLGNRSRDRRTKRALQRAGWRVFVIWECEATDASKLGLLARSIIS
jgi:DNA mismatch endonuclease (patch repair protein)